jgi:uncharacterized Zn finger protein (UPF0148 family)
MPDIGMMDDICDNCGVLLGFFGECPICGWEDIDWDEEEEEDVDFGDYDEDDYISGENTTSEQQENTRSENSLRLVPCGTSRFEIFLI